MTTSAQDMEIEEWVTFLENSIEGLRKAALELRRRKREFHGRRDWFRKKTPGIPRENSVSRALAELFIQLRAEQQITGSGVQPFDLRNISIELERPRPLDPSISDESKPTDFSLVLLKNNELDLRIEAKTVLNEGEIRSQYLGDDGLRRFEDNGNPYTLQPFGGMLAYVVDSDAKTWMTKIEVALTASVGKGRARKRKLGSEQHPFSQHDITYKARGKRIRKSVEVVHFAIEVDAKPPRR